MKMTLDLLKCLAWHSSIIIASFSFFCIPSIFNFSLLFIAPCLKCPIDFLEVAMLFSITGTDNDDSWIFWEFAPFFPSPDVDECWDGNHNCSANKFCLNTRGSYKCIDRCPGGFEFSQALKRCVDVDECLRGTHRCAGLSRCVNTQGSFRCDCPKGYRKINGVCKGELPSQTWWMFELG